MKIVINTCYGGFGLSDEAEDLYAKKNGFELFRYNQTKYKHNDGCDEYTKVNGNDTGMFSHSYKKDHGDTIDGYINDESYWYSRNIERDDTSLVEVIEELGGKKASGKCANLEVVEIPDNIEWEIEEYDGNEHIAEAHRTWG